MFLEKKTLKSTDKKQKRRFQLLNFHKKQAYLASRHAPVAQRIEHLTSNQAVTGSNPVRGTIFSPQVLLKFLVCFKMLQIAVLLLISIKIHLFFTYFFKVGLRQGISKKICILSYLVIKWLLK